MLISTKGRTINDLGGGAWSKVGKKITALPAGKKKLNCYLRGEKKTQLNNLEEKKNDQQVDQEKKKLIINH